MWFGARNTAVSFGFPDSLLNVPCGNTRPLVALLMDETAGNGRSYFHRVFVDVVAGDKDPLSTVKCDRQKMFNC
jgi:hypothetical protein